MRRALLATVFLLLTLSSTQAWADPVRVIQGSTLGFDSGDPLNFTFYGEFGVVAGQLIWSDNFAGGRCMPCAPAPGTRISADAHFGPGQLGEGFYDADGLAGFETQVFFDGFLRFVTGTSVVASRGWTAEPEANFTFTGELRGYLDASRSGSPVFQASLFGHGVVDLTLMDYGRGEGLLITEVNNYRFLDAAPTPEPTTMLLAGAGLACILRRVRSRRPGARGGEV